MLILHGMIFLVLWMYRKKLDRQVLLLILCGNLLGTGLTAAGMLEKEQPVTELERRYGGNHRSGSRGDSEIARGTGSRDSADSTGGLDIRGSENYAAGKAGRTGRDDSGRQFFL